MLAERERSLPVGWSATHLGRFAEESKDRAGTEHNLPVLSVTKHRGIVRSEEFFKKAVYSRDTSKYKVVRPGQFAYATIHLNEGSVGKFGGRTPGVVSPMYTVFDVNEQIDSDYLLAVLKSRHSLSVYESITQGTVNRRGGISFKTLSDLLLHHPPLSEQRKIAAVLASVDEAIEKTQAVIDQVEVVKLGLMQELFTKGLPGRHTRFKETRIGRIPTQWKPVRLEELCSHIVDCLHRTPNYTDAGYPAIRTSDLVAGRLLLDKARKVSTATYLEQTIRLEPIPGDILYSREGTFGLAASVPPGAKLCISQRMMHFRASPEVEPDFLMWVINSPTVYRQAVNSVGGSTVGHVNIRSIRRFLVPLPERDEQAQLAAVLNSVSRFEVTSEKALSGHQRAKRALMSVLLTGELRVTPDPEPA